jgi:hypothetical protein
MTLVCEKGSVPTFVVGNTTSDLAVPTPVKTVDGPTQPKKDATPISAHPITNIADEGVDETTKTGDVAEQVAETAVVANGKTSTEPTMAVVAENAEQVVEPMKAGDVIVVANGKTTAEPTKSVAADANGKTTTEPKAAIDVNATVAPSETQLATTEPTMAVVDVNAEIQKATTKPVVKDTVTDALTETQQAATAEPTEPVVDDTVTDVLAETQQATAEPTEEMMIESLYAGKPARKAAAYEELADTRKRRAIEADLEQAAENNKRLCADLEEIKTKYERVIEDTQTEIEDLKSANKKFAEHYGIKEREINDVRNQRDAYISVMDKFKIDPMEICNLHARSAYISLRGAC